MRYKIVCTMGVFHAYRYNNAGHIDYLSSTNYWKLGSIGTIYSFEDRPGVSAKLVYLIDREFYEKFVSLSKCT